MLLNAVVSSFPCAESRHAGHIHVHYHVICKRVHNVLYVYICASVETHSTRWLLWHSHFTEFNFGWGSARTLLGGAYNRPQTSYLALIWHLFVSKKALVYIHFKTWLQYTTALSLRETPVLNPFLVMSQHTLAQHFTFIRVQFVLYSNLPDRVQRNLPFLVMVFFTAV